MRQYSDYSFEFYKLTVKWREAKKSTKQCRKFLSTDYLNIA